MSKNVSNELDINTICNELRTLMGMNARDKEVKALLQALTEKINNSSGELNTQGLDDASDGLSGMDAKVPEVQGIISQLLCKVSNSSRELAYHPACNTLYSRLQGDDFVPLHPTSWMGFTEEITGDIAGTDTEAWNM